MNKRVWSVCIFLLCAFVILVWGAGFALAEGGENSGDPVPLTLGTRINVTLEEYVVYSYSFTPAEDGMYLFRSYTPEGYWINTDGRLYDGQGRFLDWDIDGNGFELEYPLKAGETYRLTVQQDAVTSTTAGICVFRGCATPLTVEGETGVGSTASGDPATGSEDTTGYVWYSFTLAETGVYEIFSENAASESVSLYTAGDPKTELDPEMDEEERFRVARRLTAGQYYLRLYQGSREATLVGVRNYAGLVDATVKDGYFAGYVTLAEEAANTAKTMEVAVDSTNELYSCRWYQVEEDGSLSLIPGAEGTTWTTPPVHYAQDYVCRVTDDTPGAGWRQIDVHFHVFVYTGLHAEDVTPNRHYHVTVQYNDLTFMVGAGCYELKNPVLTYQWYDARADMKSPRLIEGANESVFKPGYIKNSYPEYFCRVTDAYGNTTDVTFKVTADYYTGLRAEAVGGAYFSFNNDTWETMDDLVLEANAWCTQKDRDGNDIIPTCQWYRSTPEGKEAIPGATGMTYSPGRLLRGETYIFWAEDGFGDNHMDVYFQVSVSLDNELRAWVRGKENTVRDTVVYVPYGQSGTLAVDTSYALAEPSFQWYLRGESEEEEWIPIEGAQGDTCTTEAVTEASVVGCCVSDGTYGPDRWVTFDVRVENHLTLQAAVGDALAVGAGETAEMEVIAGCDTGLDELTFAWYEKTRDEATEEDTWVPVEGATGTTCVAENVIFRRDFRCVVTDIYDNQAHVDFMVSVENHLVAVADPAVQYIVEPYEDGTLAVVASCDDHSETYEWHRLQNSYGQQYDNIIPRATGASYVYPYVDQMEQVYYCLVRDSYGTTVRVDFVLTLVSPIHIQPGLSTVHALSGDSATLTVYASSIYGGQIWYEWVREEDYETVLEGYGENQLILENAQESGNWICRATDERGYSRELTIRLEVSEDPIVLIEHNDGLLLCPYRQTAHLSWSALSLTDEVLSCQWLQLITADGEETWVERGGRTTGLAGNMSTLSITGLTHWRCDLYREDGELFTVLEWTVDYQRDINAYAVQENIPVEQGGTAMLAVQVAGDGTFSYAWFRLSEGAEIPVEGSGATLTLRGVQSPAQYVCVVSDEAGHTARVPFTVEVTENIGWTVSALDGQTVFPVEAGESVWLEVEIQSEEEPDLTFTWAIGYPEDGETVWEELDGEEWSGYWVDSVLEDTLYRCLVSDGVNERIVEFTVMVLDGTNILRLPEGLIRLEREALAGVSADTVIIPEGCEYIDELAFAGCGQLRYVFFTGDIEKENIAQNAFEGCNDVALICEPGSGAAEYADEYGFRR